MRRVCWCAALTIAAMAAMSLLLQLCPATRGSVFGGHVAFYKSEHSGQRWIYVLGIFGDVSFNGVERLRLQSLRHSDGARSMGAHRTRRALVIWGGYPAWLPILGGLPALLLIATRRPRRHDGCCARCGYDLCRSPARCPECGTAAAG